MPTHNQLTAIGTWLYGAYSVADGRIYFGQTGAIQGETSVGNRFLQEVADARAWHKLNGSKGVKGPTYLHTMHTTGTHNWVVVLIRPTPRAQATRGEQQLIAEFPNNLNDRSFP